MSNIHSVADPVPPELYTLSLHDALPISPLYRTPVYALGGKIFSSCALGIARGALEETKRNLAERDRKSTRLNSSHTVSSYAVFCWKKTILIAGASAAYLRINYV